MNGSVKNGRPAHGIAGGFATGWFRGAGFIADIDARNNGSDPCEALKVVIPNSGNPEALQNFSVAASGDISNAAGNWVINLCLSRPLPALIGGKFADRTPWLRRPIPVTLPQPSAEARVSLTNQKHFELRADVFVDHEKETLSGSWRLLLDGTVAATGALKNLPGDLTKSFACYLQIGMQPMQAEISNVTLFCVCLK